MFQRILGRVSALVALGIFLHISSALPEYRVAAQTAPPGNGVATFTPSSLDFGAVQFQATSATQQITLSNTGTGPLGSIAISVTNSDYVITANTCGTTLAVNASCVITVSFTPSFEAPDPGGIVVTDDAATTTTTGFLTGTGVGPLYVLPFQMVFNGQAVGTASAAQQAIFTNTADGAQGIDTLTTVGNAATDFTFTQNCNLTIPAGGTCPVNVVFTPSTTGPRTADLEAATNNGTIVSHLTGNGAIRHLQGFTANILTPNDDESSLEVPLPFSINFFGTTFSSLFVNNNGNVTFTGPLSDFTPTGLTTNNGDVPIIAAYWADVDTTGATPGEQVDAGSPPSAVVTYGVDTVNGHPAFGVDYENVGYFSSHTNKLNSFQLILIDRSDSGVAGAFDIEFNYDKIQWESGDLSGGVDGLCGAQTTDCVPAAVGYSNGTGDTGTNFQLPGSFVAGALLDNGPIATSLIHQALNGTVVGRTTFQVRNGTVQSADLALTMTQAAATVPAGSQQTYTVTITNAGPNDATNVIVMNTLPNQSTLVSATPSQGAACTGTLTLTCNLGTVANGGSATLTIIVSIVPDGVGTITNSATVSSDLPDPNMGNNTASETTTIGTATNFTLSVTEAGPGTGTVTSVPTGISCPTTCAASFAGNRQVVLTAVAGTNSTVANFSTNCAPANPQTNPPTCTVTLSGNETVTVTFNSTSGPSPALAITKSHTGNFVQGQHSAQYTVTVSNAANAAASNGTVTVTDTTLTISAQDIATSFSGTSNPTGVWSYGQYVEAPPAFSLLTGQNAGFPTCGLPYWSDSGYPDVIANNTGSTVSCGTVTVPTDMLWLHPTNTGGTDAVVRWTAPASGTYEITGSYSALDSTSTTDSILVNGTSVFSTFICNPGNGKTCNTVNTLTPFAVVETLTAGSTVDFTVNCCTLPGQNFLFDSTGLTGAIDSNLSGLSLAAMFGQGWTCGPPSNAANVCTRSDALAPGASYPPITVLANVGVNAPSPQTNTVTVSGGGSAPGSATDSATINPGGTSAVLAITKSHVGNFTQGQQGATYTVTVSNGANAGPTSGTVTVADTIPAGLTLVSMAGTNWTCTANTCTRSDVLAAGASYPAITVTVNVATNAAAAVVNAVSVVGGGSATANATDPTTVGASSNFMLTITEAGNGTGTVTSAPAGVNCPTTCAASFAGGTQIVLTATPATGSTFTGWSGANSCEGTGTCTFAITAATTVTATFGGGTTDFALTVTEAGSGTGTVTSAPAGINCMPTCSANFASGTQVTLTATPATGSTFTGWSAPCEGTGTCTVTINAATAVTATFSSPTGIVVTVPSGGSTTATTTPGGTAFFGLQISGGTGVTGTVQLGCSSPSSFITCTVIPSTITLNGGTTEVAFGIQTFCQGGTTTVGFVPGGFGGGISFGFMALLLAGISGMFGKNRRVAVAFAMIMIVMALGAGSCASLPKGAGGATPAGTYSITLTTTLKGNTQTLPNFLTLVVK